MNQKHSKEQYSRSAIVGMVGSYGCDQARNWRWRIDASPTLKLKSFWWSCEYAHVHYGVHCLQWRRSWAIRCCTGPGGHCGYSIGFITAATGLCHRASICTTLAPVATVVISWCEIAAAKASGQIMQANPPTQLIEAMMLLPMPVVKSCKLIPLLSS